MKTKRKFEIFIFGLLILGFIAFMFNYNPIKEVCNCNTTICNIHRNYLTQTTDNTIQRNIHPNVEKLSFYNYTKGAGSFVRIMKLYKVSPVFESYYFFELNANKVISAFNTNDTFVIVKYNIPYIFAFIFVLFLLMIPLIFEIYEKYEKSHRMPHFDKQKKE